MVKLVIVTDLHNTATNNTSSANFASYNDFVQDNIFQLQRLIAEKLLDLLEDELISIERAAEIATEVLNIVGEDASEATLGNIKQQLAVIPELKTLNVLNF